MKNPVTKTSTIEKAYGQTLPGPIEFEYTYDEAQSLDDVPDEERLKPEDELAVINDARKANARASAQSKTLTDAGIQKPTDADLLKANPELRLKRIVDSLIAGGKSREEAVATAQMLLS